MENDSILEKYGENLTDVKYLVNPDSFSNSGTGYNKLIWNA